MSGYVIEIPQEEENSTIWSQQLRVAAYCRVSTPYEEQQQSLEKQIEYFTQYIKRNPFWRFVAVRRTGPGTRRCREIVEKEKSI